MNKEIWKDIKGYEGLYQVSNYGNVKSLKRKNVTNELIMKPRKHNNGYCAIALSKNGKCKYFLIHRLVAEAFIPNPNNLPQVNHKDENKKNNSVYNLEWCSFEYNQKYGTKIIRTSKAKSKPVICIETNIKYYGLNEASRQTNIDTASIMRCCKGRVKTAGGYHWEYANKTNTKIGIIICKTNKNKLNI